MITSGQRKYIEWLPQIIYLFYLSGYRINQSLYIREMCSKLYARLENSSYAPCIYDHLYSALRKHIMVLKSVETKKLLQGFQ